MYIKNIADYFQRLENINEIVLTELKDYFECTDKDIQILKKRNLSDTTPTYYTTYEWIVLIKNDKKKLTEKLSLFKIEDTIVDIIPGDKNKYIIMINCFPMSF